jgi:hypothetical protein
MMAAWISITLVIEVVVGNTARDSKQKKVSAKAKKHARKKTATKKPKTGTAAFKKKSVARKKAACAKKVAGKKSATRKKSPVKKPARKATTKTAKKAGAASTTSSGEATLQSGATNTTVAPEDTKSLAWMAAQAASALKAVRANQTERAQALIAKAEITPASPARSRKTPTFPLEPDISTENEDISPATAGAVDKTEKTEQTATNPAKKKDEVQPAMEAKPETTEIAPVLTPTPLASDQNASSSPANEPARIKTGSTLAAEPVVAKDHSASLADKNENIIVARQTTAATDKTASAENVPAATVIKAADAVLQYPEKTAASHTQQDAIIKSPPNQPVTQPAAAMAAATTNTRNRHLLRRLLIPGIMVLAVILGIRSWLSDDETPRLATTPVISDMEKPAPATGSKSAAEAIAVVTGKPATKPAAARVQTDNWSPAARPGWPESTSYPQRTQAPTNSGGTARQGRLPQQRSAVSNRMNGPATPRPGYYSPGYGYYPQQPVPQQPQYQPAYSRPSYLR